MTTEPVQEFLRAVSALAKEHKASFGACSCCFGVNLNVDDQIANEVEVDEDGNVSWTDDQYQRWEMDSAGNVGIAR
jgi:hypothetical protein